MDPRCDQPPAVPSSGQVLDPAPAGGEGGGGARHLPLREPSSLPFLQLLLKSVLEPCVTPRPGRGRSVPPAHRAPRSGPRHREGCSASCRCRGSAGSRAVEVVAERLATRRIAERVFFMSLRASWIASAGVLSVSPRSSASALSTRARMTRLLRGDRLTAMQAVGGGVGDGSVAVTGDQSPHTRTGGRGRRNACRRDRETVVTADPLEGPARRFLDLSPGGVHSFLCASQWIAGETGGECENGVSGPEERDGA